MIGPSARVALKCTLYLFDLLVCLESFYRFFCLRSMKLCGIYYCCIHLWAAEIRIQTCHALMDALQKLCVVSFIEIRNALPFDFAKSQNI